jgi:hypothetical protein
MAVHCHCAKYQPKKVNLGRKPPKVKAHTGPKSVPGIKATKVTPAKGKAPKISPRIVAARAAQAKAMGKTGGNPCVCTTT